MNLLTPLILLFCFILSTAFAQEAKNRNIPWTAYRKAVPVYRAILLPTQINEMEPITIELSLVADTQCFEFQGFHTYWVPTSRQVHVSAHYQRNLLKNCEPKLEQKDFHLSLAPLAAGPYDFYFLTSERFFHRRLVVQALGEQQKLLLTQLNEESVQISDSFLTGQLSSWLAEPINLPDNFELDLSENNEAATPTPLVLNRAPADPEAIEDELIADNLVSRLHGFIDYWGQLAFIQESRYELGIKETTPLF